MLLEQFTQMANSLPNPREIDLEDAVDLLVNLIEKAKSVEHVESHVDRVFKCSVGGEIIEGPVVFFKERAFCEGHAPKKPEAGPPLGRISVAERPSPRGR